MPFPSPAACGAPNPCWARLTPLTSSRAFHGVVAKGKKSRAGCEQSAPRDVNTLTAHGTHSANGFSQAMAAGTAEILLKPGALQGPALIPECSFMAVNQGQPVNLSASKWSCPSNHTSTTECNDPLGVSLFFSYFPFPACFLVIFSSVCG